MRKKFLNQDNSFGLIKNVIVLNDAQTDVTDVL